MNIKVIVLSSALLYHPKDKISLLVYGDNDPATT
jgi:hypothetical protein